MKNLEQAQREMRERQKQPTEPKPKRVKKATPHIEPFVEVNVSDESKLQQRIAALESENQSLLAELKQLRRQKTVYVEVERGKSADQERREQIHNYFKYSNARRW